MNWFDQERWSSFASEAQQAIFRPWMSAAMPTSFSESTNPDPIQTGFRQANDLVMRSMEGWASLVQTRGPGQSEQDSDHVSAVIKMFDPIEWSKAMTNGLDLTLERLTEGPTYATPTDLDRKVARAQRLWWQRAKDVHAYQQVVQAAWTRASEQFGKALNQPAEEPLTSGRAVLDLWLSLANESLLEMHHRPEFLEAQRNMARSGAEYRLQEQELAEAFCTAHHIPTRTEMDEVQRTMHELKRELRAIKRAQLQGNES